MDLSEAIRLLKAVSPSLAFERPHAEAFRVVLGEAERLAAELARLRDACARDDHEIGRVLGRALGYPRYADDPANFPGATDADGVGTGDHVAATLAAEAAERIARLTAERDEAIRLQVRRAESCFCLSPPVAWVVTGPDVGKKFCLQCRRLIGDVAKNPPGPTVDEEPTDDE